MEKTWENFYKSGKVTDYLEYRNSIKNENETYELKDKESDGAGGYSDRYGFDSHAD